MNLSRGEAGKQFFFRQARHKAETLACGIVDSSKVKHPPTVKPSPRRTLNPARRVNSNDWPARHKIRGFR